MMLVYWLLISLPVLFCFMPGYSNLLYIDSGKIGAAILGNSCTSTNEWLWMLGVSFLLLIPHLLPVSSSRLAKTNPDKRGIVCQKIPKISLSLRLLNGIWYIASIIGPLVSKKGSSRMDLLDWIEYLGAKAAWPALFNLPIVLLPTSRRSYLIEFLDCGCTRSDMLNIHTEASILTALWIALHTIFITIVYAIRDPGNFWEEMLPLRGLGGEGIVNFMGWVAAFAMFGLWLSSRAPVISRYYDEFIVVHIFLAVSFILASNLHDYNTLCFAMSGIAENIADRLMRVFSRRQGASNMVVSSYSIFDSVVKITVASPNSSLVGPGRHVYIQDPSISNQWHPFSISSVDDQNKRLSFHIKARGDWTNNLVSKLRLDQEDQAQQCVHSNIQIEGVYGSNMSPIYDQSTSCIFVAGGVGITGVSEAIQRCAERGIPCTVVWLLHSIVEMKSVGADILWNTRLLTSVAASNTKPCFQVFVTTEEEGSNGHTGDISDSFESDEQSQATAVHEETISSDVKLSALAVSSVVLVCIWLSFLLSRQMCCYRRSPDIDSAKSCGLASSSKSCQVCSVNDDIDHQDSSPEDELPCCKVSSCYLCFRALPVVMILIVSPIMAYILLFILRKYRSRYHYHAAVQQELTTIAEDPISDSSDIISMRESDRFVSEGIPYVTASDLVSVNYQRPDISAVIQNFLNTHEEIAYSSCTSVVICGPQSLIDDVSQTVKRKQLEHSGKEYRLIVL